MKRLKTLPFGAGRDVPREFQNRLTYAMLFAAIFSLAQRACNFDTSAVRNVCNSRLCDRLRSSAILWKQLSLRSSAICDPRSSAIIWKPAFISSIETLQIFLKINWILRQHSGFFRFEIDSFGGSKR